jgi:uracil-DNA glycosylase
MKLKNSEWLKWLQNEIDKGYYKKLEEFLELEYANKTIFPPQSEIFNALEITPPQKIKLVILGQDPYHKKGQAHGLSFSVNNGIAIPPSLRNIFKEIENDLAVKNINTDLTPWANQGVLLLNTVLTVVEGKADSHKDKGWEKVTDSIISQISNNNKGVIFLLWGSKAIKKKILIDITTHFILEAPHPSPLSSYRGFFGCKHFSKANKILVELGKEPINWQT